MAYVYYPFPRMIYRGEDQRIVQTLREAQDLVSEGWGPTPGWMPPPVVVAPDPCPVPIETEPVHRDPPPATRTPHRRGRWRKT